METDDSFYFAIAALIVCALELVLVPIWFFITFRKGTLDEKKNKKRCGYLYEDLNYKIRGGWTLCYPILYQLRFLVLIMVVVLMQEYLVYQVLIITLCTIAIMALLGNVHPFKVVRRNYTELASEFVIIIVMDLLLFSSDPAIEPD